MRSSTFSKMLFSFAFALFNLSAISQDKTGIFDGHADIGSNVKPGSAIYISQNDQYVVSGSGYNIWFDHDEFHYVYKKMKGDFILYARAEFVGWNGVDQHRKVGWMVRKTLDGKSANINALVPGEEGLRDIRIVEAIYKSAGTGQRVKI